MQTHAAARKEESLQQAGGCRLGEAKRGHETRGRSVVKEFRGALGHNGDSEWTERFAVLHVFIQVFLDVGRPGRSQQAAVSECARLYGFFLALFLTRVEAVARFAIFHYLLDLLAGIVRPPSHVACRSLTRLSLPVMAHVPRGPQSGSFVSRGGLNENFLESPIFFAVRTPHGIQKQSARQAQRFCAGLVPVSLGKLRGNFGASLLNARGKLLAKQFWNQRPA